MRGEVQTIPVTEGVWCFRRPSYFACSYLVATGDDAYAVDVGMDSEAADFLEAMKTTGVALRRLRAVFLTHWHNDHAAGAAFLKKEYGVRVYYHRGDEPALTRRTATVGPRAWLGRRVPEAGVLVLLRGLLEEAAPRSVAASRLVDDGDVLEGQFRVIATPGHTDGHVAYAHGPTGALFCGDALAVVGGRLRLMARPVTPDLAAARESALRCLREEARFVCPGHRDPLVERVREERLRLIDYLESGGAWPLLG